jgi:hypothetical protein
VVFLQYTISGRDCPDDACSSGKAAAKIVLLCGFFYDRFHSPISTEGGPGWMKKNR